MPMARTTDLWRRGFVKTASLGAAAIPAAGLLGPGSAEGGGEALVHHQLEPPLGYDVTRHSAALQPDRIVDSACQFCNSLCRLNVRLKDGRIIDVLGETEDPVQAGGFCVKGQTIMTQLVYNRERLRT